MGNITTTCATQCSSAADDGCPDSSIRQGESLELTFTYDPPQDLTDFVCSINVRVDNEGDPSDNELRITKILTELSANNMSYVGRLTSGETNLLVEGNYWVAGELNNSTTGENQETVCQFEITKQYVFPDPSAVEDIVAAAEANPTPETQSTAQLAVNSLPAGTGRDAFQARLDALDPEVQNVVDARLLVIEAETYPWTSTKQDAAQSAVDALVSPVERTNLSVRLSNLDDEVAATDAVDRAELSRSQSDIDAAQILINNIDPPENQVQLQARLDGILTFLRLVTYSGSFSAITNSYFLSKAGLRCRMPGIGGSFRTEFSLAQNSGWASIAVTVLMRPAFNIFYGIGDILSISESSIGDQGQGGLNSILVGDNIYYNGANVADDETDIILVVNYSGTNPVVYVVGAGSNIILLTQTLPITTSVTFGINTQSTHTDSEREYLYELNVGSDLANRPFPADAEQILIDAAVDTTGYVEGWGQTQSLDLQGAPTFGFTTPAPVSPTIGVEFTIGANVIDSDGLDRSSLIRWRNKYDNWLLNNNVINGAEIAFTPESGGHYEFVAEFEDQTGKIFKINRIVIVPETVSMAGNLAFQPAGGGPLDSYPTITINSEVPPHGLNSIANNGATYNDATPFKKGAMGNISIYYGEYRYLEFKCASGGMTDLFGFGFLSILNENVGWSGGASGGEPQEGAGGVSVLNANQFQSFIGQPWINGGNSTYRGDGMGQGSVLNTDFDPSGGVMGFAVDYREVGEPAIIHVVHSINGGTPAYAFSFRLWNCRTPIRPIAYVNQQSQTLVSDTLINGQEVNMVHDVITILDGAGVDVTDLKPYWGDADAI